MQATGTWNLIWAEHKAPASEPAGTGYLRRPECCHLLSLLRGLAVTAAHGPHSPLAQSLFLSQCTCNCTHLAGIIKTQHQCVPRMAFVQAVYTPRVCQPPGGQTLVSAILSKRPCT